MQSREPKVPGEIVTVGWEPRLTAGMKRRPTVTKFLIGVVTAALWFVLSHAANAERLSRDACDCSSHIGAMAGDVVIRR
jgi:hypothetical protein